MPLYEYECLPHGHRYEVRHGINESPVSECPECGGEVRRVIHPVGVVFKGSGFYVTDSRKSSTGAKAGEKAKSESGSEKSETKSESKGETKKSDGAKESAAS